MKIQYTTRIEQEILDDVKAIADQERRSLNNTVEFLLAKAVENYKEERGQPQVLSQQ